MHITEEMLLSDQSVAEITEDRNEDLKLQRAFEEMRRLDEILSAEIIKEREIRHQTKQLKTKQWQELQVYMILTYVLLKPGEIVCIFKLIDFLCAAHAWSALFFSPHSKNLTATPNVLMKLWTQSCFWPGKRKLVCKSNTDEVHYWKVWCAWQKY